MSAHQLEAVPIEAAAVTARYAVASIRAQPIDDPTSPVAFVLPEGSKLEVPNLDRFEKYAPAPRRVVGTYAVRDVDSFVALVGRHFGAGSTIWVDPDANEITAVFNDHGGDDGLGPAWGDHRCFLPLRTTPEWDAWVGRDGRLVPQQEFAEFLELHQLDLIDPTPATMLEVAQTIHSTTDVSYKSGYRLEDGQQVYSWEEDTTTTAGAKGDLAIPREFTIGVAPFVGEDPFRIRAMLKTRTRDRKLFLGYQLERPHLVLDASIDAIARRLRDGRDGIAETVAGTDETIAVQAEPGFARVFLGRPAKPRTIA